MKHLPLLRVAVIPHRHQNYDTAGDYFQLGEDNHAVWMVRVSAMSDWRHEALVMIHELVEMILTKNDGVTWKDIDEFDKTGGGKDHPDPGTIPEAPYHQQHTKATEIERKMAEWLNIDWEAYDASFDALEY